MTRVQLSTAQTLAAQTLAASTVSNLNEKTQVAATQLAATQVAATQLAATQLAAGLTGTSLTHAQLLFDAAAREWLGRYPQLTLGRHLYDGEHAKLKLTQVGQLRSTPRTHGKHLDAALNTGRVTLQALRNDDRLPALNAALQRQGWHLGPASVRWLKSEQPDQLALMLVSGPGRRIDLRAAHALGARTVRVNSYWTELQVLQFMIQARGLQYGSPTSSCDGRTDWPGACALYGLQSGEYLNALLRQEDSTRRTVGTELHTLMGRAQVASDLAVRPAPMRMVNHGVRSRPAATARKSQIQATP